MTDKPGGVTRTAFFRVLKEIRDKLDNLRSTAILVQKVRSLNIDLDSVISRLDTIIGHIDTIESTLSSIDTKVATEATLSTIESTRLRFAGRDNAEILDAIDASLDAIESDAEQLRIDNLDDLIPDTAAIRSNIESLEDTWNLPFGAMAIATTAIAVNTTNNATTGRQDDIRDRLKELLNFASGYALVIDFNVTSIAGGTLIDVRIQNTGSQQLFIEDIMVRKIGVAHNITIAEHHTSTGTFIKNIAPSISLTGIFHFPFRNALVITQFSGDGFSLKSGHEIRIKYIPVAVADRLFIAIEGLAREDSLPTIDTSNSSATITTTTTEHDVNAQN